MINDRKYIGLKSEITHDLILRIFLPIFLHKTVLKYIFLKNSQFLLREKNVGNL